MGYFLLQLSGSLKQVDRVGLGVVSSVSYISSVSLGGMDVLGVVEVLGVVDVLGA